MDVNEILASAIGAKEDGTPKALVGLAYKFYKEGVDHLLTRSEIALHNPIVEINQANGLTQVCLQFPSPIDRDMRLTWNVIQRYEVDQDGEMEEGDDVPIMVLSIIPEAYNGRYYISASMPLFCFIQAEQIDCAPQTISLLFRDDDVLFYESDEIDMTAIDAEIERELSERERLEDLADQKNIDHEIMLARRNAIFQAKRKF